MKQAKETWLEGVVYKTFQDIVLSSNDSHCYHKSIL